MRKIAVMHGKGKFSRKVFATFPWKLQIYSTNDQNQQFPMDYLLLDQDKVLNEGFMIFFYI